ncbi:MAG TPA: hypothetical protein PK812_02175 [Beijerinckiaceae bacterium]|nr:hypothetical protein [Beijerinckiaceae bacterium]
MHRLPALAVLTLAVTAAAAHEAPDLDRMFPVGGDFCFARAYDAAHMAKHPRQVVRAIQVMGRNAHRTAAAPGETAQERTVPGLNVRASLRVTFRDGAVRDWPGTCHEDGDLPGHPAVCRFVPARNPDTLEFGLRLKRTGAAVDAVAFGDIGRFRRALDEGSDRRRDSDDRVFRLHASTSATCAFPAKYWSARGATRALEIALP